MRNIYYVVVEQRNVSEETMYFSLNQILKVFACDIADTDRIFREFVEPLQRMGSMNGGYVNTYIFHRESSLFANMAEPYRSPLEAQPKELTWEEKEQARLDAYQQHEAWKI